jgi:hypothetical protein
MGEKKTKISVCILVMTVVVITSVGQALIPTHLESKRVLLPENFAPLKGGSVDVWEDDFFNSSKIDPALSHHYVLDTNAGVISMQNTYPAWTDPSFTRMKPLTIFNDGAQTCTNYDVNLTILYDADMQADFDDLRFTDLSGAPLSYYKLKKTNGVSADMLVKIPLLPPGETTIEMFYGNPTATDQSNFTSVFTWWDRASPDVMVSHKGETEGAWDPDVEYGGGRFLVSWEERLGPEDISIPLPHWERTIYSVIHGRTYNTTGGDPYPDPNLNLDIDISDPVSTSYHAENPCIAYGAGKYFVVWEENVANQPLQRYEADIKGAMVTTTGQVTSRFTICSQTGGQFEPQIAFDSMSNQFLVVWADARYGNSDFDVRGRLCNSNGFPVAPDFAIAYEANYQGYPWVSTDNKGNFFIAYVDGPDPQVGPFSLYAVRYDSNGNRVGSRISIASGTATTDYIFPAVSYNAKTERYFVAWNDGDVSVDPADRASYDGNIWGKILSRTGSVIKNNYIIEAGTSFIRTDIVPYFDTMFYLAYDGTIAGNQDIYGRLISSDGTVMTSRQEISDGSSQNVDWNNLAVGPSGVFATWEDERDEASQYADVFGYVWRLTQSFGSSNITSSAGVEVELIAKAQVMSIPITPEDFRQWRQFFSRQTLPAGTLITVDIMDQNGTILLKGGVTSGQNVSEVNASVIRLRATLSRITPQDTPVLDSWNISCYVGRDIYPPATTIMVDPAEPNGNNSWYVSPVTVSFTVSDVDSEPGNITTFYRINGLGIETYHPEQPVVISSDGPNNSIEYWSNDTINEEFPHQRIEGIKIDTSSPMITFHEPSYIISPGNATVNGSVTDYTSGSGIDRVKITVNEETIFDKAYSGEHAIWFEWNFTADRGEAYEIYVEVWDKAGNTMEDRRTVTCPDRGLYDLGYIYLFDNPKTGPIQLLVTLGLSIAVNYDSLYVVLPGVTGDIASVKFIATQVYLGQEFVFWDMNLTDGCSCDLQVPFGFYEIHAVAYDNNNNQLATYPIITKMLTILI